MSRRANKTRVDQKPMPAPSGPSRGWRIALSLAILWHLTAVALGPYSMGGSIFAEDLRAVMAPYLRATFLDNGYQFFAPEPGPSHLVGYRLVHSDGSTREGTFPDLDEQWPRLLYHRHFMLSEYLNGRSVPPEPPADLSPEELAEYSRAKTTFQAYLTSYAQHLLAAHDAREVTLVLRRHNFPSMPMVRDGVRLDDKRLFEELPLGTFTREIQ